MIRIFTRDPKKIAAAYDVTEKITEEGKTTIIYRRIRKDAGDDEYHIEQWEEEPPPPPPPPSPLPKLQKPRPKKYGPCKKRGIQPSDDVVGKALRYRLYQRRYYHEKRKGGLEEKLVCPDCGRAMRNSSLGNHIRLGYCEIDQQKNLLLYDADDEDEDDEADSESAGFDSPTVD